MHTTATAILLTMVAVSAAGQGVTPPPPPPPPSETSGMAGIGRDVAIVSGNATVSMTPDTISITGAFSAEGKDLRALLQSSAATTARVVAALKGHGVSAPEIRTTFSLSPHERKEKRDGYEVKSEIGVTHKGASDAGDLIVAMVEAGANEISGPQFSVADEKAVQTQCTELAFADARTKAESLAKLSQRKLGRVLAVTDGSSSPFELKYHSPGVEGGVVGGFMEMQLGTHTVDCGVTVAFKLD